MEPSSKPPRNGVEARRGKRQRTTKGRGEEKEKGSRELVWQCLEKVITIVGEMWGCGDRIVSGQKG